MAFIFAMQDDPPPSGFDLGQLVLADPRSGKESARQFSGKWYMAYIEAVVLLDQFRSARLNRTVGQYHLPDGSSAKFDGVNRAVEFIFPDLKLYQPLDEAISDLVLAIQSELSRIENQLSGDDSGIRDLRAAITR